MSIEEEQQVRHCLSEENFQAFRQDQVIFYGKLLSIFGLPADGIDPRLFGNLALAMMMVYKAIPDTMPFLFPEVSGGYGGIPGQGPGGRDGTDKRVCTTGKSGCIAVGSYVQMDTTLDRVLAQGFGKQVLVLCGLFMPCVSLSLRQYGTGHFL